MNTFFGMGVPTANPNDPTFFLRLPHLWAVFLIPIVCFYAFLTVWVAKKVREAMAAENHVTGAGLSSDSTNVARGSGTIATDEKSSDSGRGSSPFDLRFYRCFDLTS
jgi:hypothetical protein